MEWFVNLTTTEISIADRGRQLQIQTFCTGRRFNSLLFPLHLVSYFSVIFFCNVQCWPFKVKIFSCFVKYWLNCTILTSTYDTKFKKYNPLDNFVFLISKLNPLKKLLVLINIESQILDLLSIGLILNKGRSEKKKIYCSLTLSTNKNLRRKCL